MALTDEIARLEDQWRAGTLSDDEFKMAKAKLLGQDAPRSSFGGTDANQWAMWLHFSMLSGFVVAGAGFLAPIIIWLVKKDDIPSLDQHGKNAVNWLISSLIYALVCFLLTFIIIGIPMLIALGICGVIFPIIAGLKASKGEYWKYPMSIEFLK